MFQKLLPQIQHDPFLIVAVAGGTNTGKSVIFNHLAGGLVSRAHPNATQTRHPVCLLPQNFAQRSELADVFPDFELRPWTNENDPLSEGPDQSLFVREDPLGRQPARLLLLDTPDVDGTLKTNWRRADLVRHAADVLVCVLTQQKYNDAAIREFFRAAAEAEKTVIVVFNMLHWPRQRELCSGWLEQFTSETGVQPAAVYAVPWDPEAAEQNRLPFYPLSEGASDLRQDLAELQFDAIKIRSLAGSLRRVVDEADGLPAFLESIDNRAAEYAGARDLLDHDIRKQDVELPDLPRKLVWDEIWKWLESRRTRFDRWIHGTYRALSDMVTSLWRRDPAETLDDFRRAEFERLQAALAAKLDQLERLAAWWKRDSQSRIGCSFGRSGALAAIRRTPAPPRLCAAGNRRLSPVHPPATRRIRTAESGTGERHYRGAGGNGGGAAGDQRGPGRCRRAWRRIGSRPLGHFVGGRRGRGNCHCRGRRSRDRAHRSIGA